MAEVSVSQNPREPVNAHYMLPGQLGIDDEGRVWFRTIYTITCLTEPGRTFTASSIESGVFVRILAPDEVVTLHN